MGLRHPLFEYLPYLSIKIRNGIADSYVGKLLKALKWGSDFGGDLSLGEQGLRGAEFISSAPQHTLLIHVDAIVYSSSAYLVRVCCYFHRANDKKRLRLK